MSDGNHETQSSQAQERIVRAHDVTTCLERTEVVDFDSLTLLGLAVRLSLHLRGVPAVRYETLRKAAHACLDFPLTALRAVLDLLAEAEFVFLATEGKSIKTVVPQIPYYDDIFVSLGEISESTPFNETEELTIELLGRLSRSPLRKETAYSLGAERRLVDRVLEIGQGGAFLDVRRARGEDILLSPAYFTENAEGFSDLVAEAGSGRVGRILSLLKENQGWPLSKIEKEGEIRGSKILPQDLALLRKMAGEGFVSPPAITTSHAGEQFFLFGPQPGQPRLPPHKKPIYEAAMALVSAVRQGQFLANQYRIYHPEKLLSALLLRGSIKANTEAKEQYRHLVYLKVGRLEQKGSHWAEFHLIDRPENKEAVRLALQMLRSGELEVAPDEEMILALKRGEDYLESLVGRKRMAERGSAVALSEEDQLEVETLLLSGSA